MSAIIVRLAQLVSPRMAIAVRRLVRIGQRNRRAREIRKRRRYFQRAGICIRTNRILDQINLFLDRDNLRKL